MIVSRNNGLASHHEIGAMAPTSSYSTSLSSITTNRNHPGRPSLSHSDSFRNNIFIVNTNYDHYGQSVLNRTSSRPEASKTSSGLPFHSTNLRSEMSSNPEKNVKKQDKPKLSYRSLLAQSESNTLKKFFKLDHTDIFRSTSTKSQSSLFLPVTIESLPLEILQSIVNFADDYRSQVTCLYVNRAFYEATKPLVYEKPLLRSTYRVAQLITSIREKPSNGQLIKVLDLSKLEAGAIPIEESSEREDEMEDDESMNQDSKFFDYAFASWRDWKYRGDPLYGSSVLNSYNLSRSKSTLSLESLSEFSTRTRFMNILRTTTTNIESSYFGGKFKGMFKLKLRSGKRSRSYSESNVTIPKKPAIDSKNVSFCISRPELQPFVTTHPYTNKFLLKYAASKDLPIGYVLYFIELCPNIVDLNLSLISLSPDHKIVYHNKDRRATKSSLVEDALLIPLGPMSPSRASVDLNPKYLSDANVYFNIKTFENEMRPLTETDILESIIVNLRNLQKLNLSSIPWLNFKNIQDIFLKNENSLVNDLFMDDSLNLEIDLSNSGMIKNMKWSKFYKDLSEFAEMFSKTQEQIVEMERDPITVLHEDIIRNLGMNY